MNKLQKLISDIEDEGLQAHRQFRKLRDLGDEQALWNQGYYLACKLHAEKLKLLLNDESKQPQPPISQTPMLGEVLPVGHSNISESSPAVEGATPFVGQNEQTKELCQCGEEMHDGCDCYEKNECYFCGLPLH